MNISPVSSIQNKTNSNFKGAPKIAPSMISQTNAFLHETKASLGRAYDSFIQDGVAKHFVAPIINSNLMTKFIDKMGNSKNMASHMSTGGSFVTTAFYIRQTDKTLNKNEEQRKRAKTLELNQGLVTVASTVLGYTANGALGKISKNLGYKFREANQNHPKLSTRMKGFDIAKQLLIFSLMYRYVAPVFVTPVASKLSKWNEVRKADKAAKQAKIVEMQQQPKAKEIALNTQVKSKSA